MFIDSKYIIYVFILIIVFKNVVFKNTFNLFMFKNNLIYV